MNGVNEEAQTFPLSASYARFLIDNHADAFFRDNYQRAKDSNFPLLRLTVGRPDEEVYQEWQAGTMKRFLLPFAEDRALEGVKESISMWKTHANPEMAPWEVSGNDIVIIYQTRRASLLAFMHLYQDFKFEILQEIESYFSTCLKWTLQVYDELHQLRAEKSKEMQMVLESLPAMAWTANAKAEIDYYANSWQTYLGDSFENLKKCHGQPRQ